MSSRPAEPVAAPGPPESAAAAVRGELRAALGDLSATLAGSHPPDVAGLYESLRHTWILADLAELDELADNRVKAVLHALHRELRAGGETLDSRHFANQLAGVADRL